jgi:large subunit ribosomal protein L25
MSEGAGERAAEWVVAARPRPSGKHASRELRARGHVPAVVYGHGEPVPVALSLREAQAVVGMPPNHVFALALEGRGREDVRLVAVQREATTGRLLHLDLERVRRGERTRAEVPVHVRGEEELIRRGGVVARLLDAIEVEGEAMHLPSAVEVDVSHRAAGDHVTAGDLSLPPGVALVTPPQTPVLHVTHPARGGEEGAPGEPAER